MSTIIIEGVLFVAMIAAGGALFLFVVWHFTPLGTRLRQRRNRRLIEREAELACPIHGAHRDDEMVRLPSGGRVCPECFRETVWQTR